MALNPGQEEIANSGARFRVVIAGRRWGKTFLSVREMAKAARYPNRNVWYVAPTYRMCKQIVWDNLKYKLQDLNWVAKINESDLSITLKNGSKISLRGADNPDSLRGVSLDFCVLDEFAMIDESAWTSVLRPTLSDRKGSAMFISTPMGRNWAYDLYQKGLDPTEHTWESFQYTTIQGGNVSQEEIDAARQDLDAKTFRQEYEATFEEYANRIYYAFDRNQNIRLYQGAIPALIYVGMDFNVDNMSAVLFTREGNTIHAFDEIHLRSSNTSEMASELQSRYPKSRFSVYPDSAGSARKTSAEIGVTDHTILRNAGFTVKSPRAHNPVKDGINAVNSKLCNAKDERTFFVDPRCKKTIESLEKHTYKEGTSIPDKESGYDHFSDALRYYIDYEFPVRRDVDPATLIPQRWGHKTI
jgi:hypothetical protein